MVCLSMRLHLDASEKWVPPSVVLFDHYEGQKDQRKGDMKGYSIKVVDRHDDAYWHSSVIQLLLDSEGLLLDVGLAIWMVFGRLSRSVRLQDPSSGLFTLEHRTPDIHRPDSRHPLDPVGPFRPKSIDSSNDRILRSRQMCLMTT